MLRPGAGLPEAFGPALQYLVTDKLDPERRAIAARVEAVRADTAALPDSFLFEEAPSPFGFVRLVMAAPSRHPGPLSAQWVAHTASVAPRWGMALHLLAAASGARTILELGSCAGISGGYLASAPACRQLFTIEGSPGLARLAEANLRRIADHCAVIAALFDDGLDRVLPRLPEGLDLALPQGPGGVRPVSHREPRRSPGCRPPSRGHVSGHVGPRSR
ncbi:MAG: hypothetical protein ACRELA_15925 [Candidatus Rokuibacteriota bacterium]